MRVTAAVVLMLAACSSSPAGPDELDENDEFGGKADGPLGTGTTWANVGLGVAYQQVNTGHAVLIAYGGYSAQLAYSAAWATELVDARLGAAEVGHVYAVKGPMDPGYDAREIANSKLRAHLATIDDGTSPIYIIAHSSGSYVAHELLGQLDGNTAVLGRIGYANLDGGGTGLTTALIDSLRKITFVYAHDPTLASGYSENNATERALGDDYAPHATSYEVVAPMTGCNSGAGWCLHDVLITHRPHNHDTYDLADDYTDFVGRAPTIEYLDTIE